MMPLGLLAAGEAGEIIAIRSGAAESARTDCRVEDLGLRVGSTVEMLNNAGGPVLLREGESRLALDRGLAMKIMIKEGGR